MPIASGKIDTAVVTSVNATTTVGTLAAANTARHMLSLYNNGAADVYVKLGTGASASSFTTKLVAGAYWELPRTSAGGRERAYSGAVTALAASGTQAILVTEW